MAAAFKLGDPGRVADHESRGAPPIPATRLVPTPRAYPPAATPAAGIAIDHNIPLPPGRGCLSAGQSKYPLAKMNPGDSFFVPGKFSTGGYNFYAKKTGAKFVTRRVTEGGVSGTRVWMLTAPKAADK